MMKYHPGKSSQNVSTPVEMRRWGGGITYRITNITVYLLILRWPFVIILVNIKLIDQ